MVFPFFSAILLRQDSKDSSPGRICRNSTDLQGRVQINRPWKRALMSHQLSKQELRKRRRSSQSQSDHLGPFGRLEASYFPVSIPSPSGLYAMRRMPNESHTVFSSIWSSPMLSSENWTCITKCFQNSDDAILNRELYKHTELTVSCRHLSWAQGNSFRS